MVRRLTLGAVVAGLIVLVSGCVAAPTPVALTLPSSTAFAMLGHSCGGIQEQAFATGFDPTSGLPTGAVYLQTRCGGSGRGGGYTTTTYSAWAGVTWDFAGAVHDSVKLAAAPAGLDPAFSQTDVGGDRVYTALTATNVTAANCTVGNTTYCSYHAYLTVPVPGTPSGVTMSQVGDSLAVSWTAPATGAVAITSTTVTATPVGGGAVLTATAPGPATSVQVNGVAPSTTYSVTVASTDASGTGPASAAVTFTTHAATTAPTAPTGLTAAWNAGSTGIVAAWVAPDAGDSPIDDYQVAVAQSDPTGPPTNVDAGTATSATLTGFDSTLDWSVHVRAHNAAGWGPWSTSVVVSASN